MGVSVGWEDVGGSAAMEGSSGSIVLGTGIVSLEGGGKERTRMGEILSDSQQRMGPGEG